MRKGKFGKTMRTCGLGMAFVFCCSTVAYGEEVYEEIPVIEIVEEYVIEPEVCIEEMMATDLVVMEPVVEELFLEDGFSVPEMFGKDEFPVPEAEEILTDTDIIQEAINTETEVTITVKEDMVLDATIFIPSGKKVTLVPENGEHVTMFRGEELCGTFFFVEKDATLILGYDNSQEGSLTLDTCEENLLMAGEGEVRFLNGVEEDTFIGDEEMQWETADLKDAYVEILNAENLVYNGKPQTPDVWVWMGTQMLMKGFDYDITFQNNINAGMAEVLVTATGIGTCTGIGSGSFLIQPAVPEYVIANQTVEGGVELSQLVIPEYATGVDGARVDGTLYWSVTEGGSILPDDMMLSGTAGDVMNLYWTFYPEDVSGNYAAVSGKVEITFVMPDFPDFGDNDLWGDLGDNVGDLSGGSSSSGVTGGEDITVDLSTEAIPPEVPETEAPETEAPETEAPGTEQPESEEPETERLPGTTSATEGPRGENSSGKGTSSGNSVVTNKGVSMSSSVSVRKTNPRTGDENCHEVWLGLSLLSMALAAWIFILDTKGGILYNGKR